MDAQGALNSAFDATTNRLRLTFVDTVVTDDSNGHGTNGIIGRAVTPAGELKVMRI